MRLVDYIQRVAIPANKFHFHRKNDKLTGYVPKVGQVMITEGFEEQAIVIRAANSVKDFVVEFPSGERVRKNLVNKDIEGFVDV